MPRLMLAAPIVLLAACAERSPMPLRHAADNGVCRESGLDQFKGQEASEALAITLIRASGARTIRWIQPGQAVTMDHSESRLNVQLDSANRITGLSCG